MKTETRFNSMEETLRLEVRLSDARDFALSEWRRLESRIGSRGLSCSADWTEVWLNVYGDLVPHRFLLAIDKDDGRLVGVCLVTEGVAQKDGPLPIHTLHVGTAGEPEPDSVCVEYNRLLAEPRYERDFAAQILEYLDSQSGFDQWNLDGFAESDLAVFVSGELPLELRREPTWWFDLKQVRETGSDVLTELRSSTRRKVKRSLEAYKDLTVEFSRSLDQAIDIFGELIELHQSRWKAAGRPGSYSSERFTRFHEELLARLVPDGRMAFVRVRSSDGTVGCVQLLIDRNRALFYQCGWAAAEGKRSPGVVLDYLAMQECLERGFDAYDFLAFATQHKRHLSNACHDIVWARRKHPKLKFAVLDQARRVKQFFKRSQKAKTVPASQSEVQARDDGSSADRVVPRSRFE